MPLIETWGLLKIYVDRTRDLKSVQNFSSTTLYQTMPQIQTSALYISLKNKIRKKGGGLQGAAMCKDRNFKSVRRCHNL